jgi:hypothetical protein
MKKPSLLNPEFRYTPSGATDIRKLFARVRKAQREEEQKRQVIPMRRNG